MSHEVTLLDSDRVPARSPGWGTSESGDENTSVLAGRYALMVLKHAHDVTLILRWGRIWIALDRDPADYILSGGQQMVIRSKRPVLLEAWRKSRIEFVAAGGSRFEIARASGSLCVIATGEKHRLQRTAAQR